MNQQRSVGGFNIDDYVDVAHRIIEFRTKYPEGSLQSEILELPVAFAGGFIAVKGYAYRTPDDSRPGVGLAWEPVPGKSNFTRDSELQNAETAAWGRAIVAALAADTKKGIASSQEVRARREDQESPLPPPPKKLTEHEDMVIRLTAFARGKGCIIEDGALDGISLPDLRQLWNEIGRGKYEGQMIQKGRIGPSLPADSTGAALLSSLPEDMAVLVLDKFKDFEAAEKFLSGFKGRTNVKGEFVWGQLDLSEIEKACR